jgi:hypothetical protein
MARRWLLVRLRVPPCHRWLLKTTTVPAGAMSLTSSGWASAGSGITSRTDTVSRWEPGTTRVAPLSWLKSSSSQIELHT